MRDFHRLHWPVRVFKLGREPRDDLSESTSVAERLSLVDELTARAWSLTGKPMPDYARDAIPVVVRRRP